MDAICIKDLKKDLKREMDDSRYEHTLGVMYTSAALAMRYEYDMERAMPCNLAVFSSVLKSLYTV